MIVFSFVTGFCELGCYRMAGDWPISFPHSPATVQITLSSVKPCLSFIEMDCFHALWNDTVLQFFSVYYASKNNCILFEINFHSFYYSVFLLLVFLKVLE
jgi:hypothetical protein